MVDAVQQQQRTIPSDVCKFVANLFRHAGFAPGVVEEIYHVCDVPLIAKASWRELKAWLDEIFMDVEISDVQCYLLNRIFETLEDVYLKGRMF